MEYAPSLIPSRKSSTRESFPCKKFYLREKKRQNNASNFQKDEPQGGLGMKRITAIILAGLMITSSACGKKESTPSGTEISGTETSGTVEPSESSEKETAISVSESASQAETEAPVEAPIKAECKRDLTYISYEKETKMESRYIYPVSNGYVEYDENPILQYDSLTISGQEYYKLRFAIDEVIDPFIKDLRDTYNKNIEYLEGKVIPDENRTGEWHTLWVTVHRADSMAFSFDLEDHYYNFDSKTGELITISDIVKDKAAFEDLICRYMEPFTKNPSTYGSQSLETVLHRKVEDDSLDFILNYDGLTLKVYSDEDTNPYYFNSIKISAMRDPEIFNMDYFGHTPENYVLRPNDDGWIYWDFNDDGILDALGTNQEINYEGITGFADISFGMGRCEFKPAKTYSTIPFTFLKSDDGKYLYIEEEYNLGTRCAKLEDDFSMHIVDPYGPKVSYSDALKQSEDPAKTTHINMVYLLGYRSMYEEFSFTGKNGIPEKGPVYYSDRPEVMKSNVSLSGFAYDPGTGTKGGNLTIPKGSLFDIIEYNDQEGMILFRITPPGEKTHGSDYYAVVEFSGFALKIEEYHYPQLLDGKKVDDVFDYLPSIGG